MKLAGKVDTDEHPVISVHAPITDNHISPINCLEEMFIDEYTKVKVSEYFKCSKLIKITSSLRILDLSECDVYKNMTLFCKISQSFSFSSHNTYTFDMNIRSKCDLNDSKDVDIDGVCNVMMSTGDKLNITLKDKHINLYEKALIRKDDPDSKCKDCYYDEYTTNRKNMSFIFRNNNNGKYELTTSTTGYSKNDPVYIINNMKDRNYKGIIKPTEIIRVYLYDKQVGINDNGQVRIEEKDKLSDDTIIYSISMNGRNYLRLKCSDFIKNGGDLYPKGKNTIFNNYDQHKDLKDAVTVQLEDVIGIKGLSIIKKIENPKSGHDLEIRLENDNYINSENIKPLYFICKPHSGNVYKPLAIISIDLGYNNYKPLNGCGLKSELFLDEHDKQSKNNNSCQFNLNNNTIGFHCPSYIPEQFLSDNQDSIKPLSNHKDTKNPYKLLIKCYDRSTIIQKFIKPLNDLEIFKQPNDLTQVQSLWIFNKSMFKIGDYKATTITCVCYNKKGDAISSIIVNDSFTIQTYKLITLLLITILIY